MKDSRVGESLWEEWEGLGYETLEDKKIFYTIDHVSLDNEIVRRALASTLQRDGIADSLGDGFKLLEKSVVSHNWAGFMEEDNEINLCDDSGYTLYGDFIEDINPVTIVEF